MSHSIRIKWKASGLPRLSSERASIAMAYLAMVRLALRTAKHSRSQSVGACRYFFLLFSDDDTLLPLTDFVFNTEAHPIPVTGSSADLALRRRYLHPPHTCIAGVISRSDAESMSHAAATGTNSSTAGHAAGSQWPAVLQYFMKALEMPRCVTVRFATDIAHAESAAGVCDMRQTVCVPSIAGQTSPGRNSLR